MKTRLTLGPILFHWPEERKLDFYARIADEAPIDTVYLGEVVCSKRAPFFEKHYGEVIGRLERGGKAVVLSSLCEVMTKRERRMAADFAGIEDHDIEVNNASVLFHLDGRPHRIGPMMNVYGEQTMGFLHSKGARHFCIPPELPRASAEVLAAEAARLGVGIELMVFGRAPLAVSARCYHARAHGRSKDNCRFVCEEDPDGMPLRTVDGRDFLAVNGIQTLSHAYLNYVGELDQVVRIGFTDLRLSPHTLDMVAVAGIFRDALDGAIGGDEARHRLERLAVPAPFANGFWYGRPGHVNVTAPAI